MLLYQVNASICGDLCMVREIYYMYFHLFRIFAKAPEEDITRKTCQAATGFSNLYQPFLDCIRLQEISCHDYVIVGLV